LGVRSWNIFSPENKGSKFFRNIDTSLLNYGAISRNAVVLPRTAVRT
jgi:hypothetical protein